MSGAAARSESASPRRKRSLSSLVTSDDQDASDNRLKRASIACVTCRKRVICCSQCDGLQPSCTNCTKHRKLGCTYVRVTPEENLEAKARKRLAREQKEKYAALGIEPPPTLNTGRRRWEYNIRFQQQKLDLTRRRSSSSSATATGESSEPAGAPEALGDYSPEGFSTSTWRVGDMVRQAASHPAAVPTPAEAMREYYGQVKPQGGEWAASTTTTMRAKYLDSQPGRRASGPVAAYSPYPLTPPMEDYHPGEGASAPSGGAGAGGGSGLGMYAAEEGSWMLPPSTSNGGAGASRTDPSGSHFSSWQSQRTITVQRVPKSLAQVQHVPVKPAPLLPLLPQIHQHHHPHHHHSGGGPYSSSPHGGGGSSQQQQQLFPTGLPAPVSVQPPPVPLYAPNPTRPARTCSFIQQVGSPAPPSSSENGSPHAPPLAHAAPAASEWCLPPPVDPYPPAVQGPSLILSPPDYPQHVFHHQHQHQHHHHDGAPPRDSPAYSAPPLLPSTSWNGSLYTTPVMRQVGSFQGDEWSASGPGPAHSTPDLYSQTGW